MMKVTVRQVVLASALGTLSFVAQAYGNAGAPSAATSDQNATAAATPKMAGGDAAQGESRYEAAQAACEQQTGNAKADCLRTAATEYENAIGAAPSSGATAASPASPANTGAAQSGSTESPGSASGPAPTSNGSGMEGAGKTSRTGNGG